MSAAMTLSLMHYTVNGVDAMPVPASNTEGIGHTNL